MPIKVPRFSRTCALSATPWVPTALDQSFRVSSEDQLPLLMDSPTRKSQKMIKQHFGFLSVFFVNGYWQFHFYSGALSGKGGKWTEKTLDKYLKSPADYAPGKLRKWIAWWGYKANKRVSELWLTNMFFLGNAMAFAGLANAKDRADVIAYLKSNSWAHKWKTHSLGAKQVFYVKSTTYAVRQS